MVGLDVQLLNGSLDFNSSLIFLFSFIFFKYETIETHALAFFKLNIYSIGTVFPLTNSCCTQTIIWYYVFSATGLIVWGRSDLRTIWGWGCPIAGWKFNILIYILTKGVFWWLLVFIVQKFLFKQSIIYLRSSWWRLLFLKKYFY